ncbi:MAG: type II CAAX prenyl endopeptidase Rce1 family protein [Bacteroidales bacterium]
MSLRNTFVNIHPGIRLMIVFTLVFIGLFISQIISGIILYSATSSELAITEVCIENVNINVLKIVQLINSVFVLLLPAYVVAVISSPDPVYHLKMRRIPGNKEIIFTILWVIASIGLVNLMASWNASLNLPDGMEQIEQMIIRMEESARKLQERMLDAANIGGLLVNIFVLALVPAVCEELLFRGVIQRLLKEWTNNIHIAILVAAILFSFVHFQFYGFLPRLFLGVMFGYLLYWTGSLWVPVIAHFTNNALAAIWYYIYFKSNESAPNPDEFGADPSSVWLYISILGYTAILIWFVRFRKKRKLSG